MKRYYFKKNEKELKRLKKDLAFYATIQTYSFQEDECEDEYVCQIKRNESTNKAITFVVRKALSNSLTIQIGCVNWLSQDDLIKAFFPELNNRKLNELPIRLLDKPEREIRHDVKMIAKVRLGSYFNQREDAE